MDILQFKYSKFWSSVFTLTFSLISCTIFSLIFKFWNQFSTTEKISFTCYNIIMFFALINILKNYFIPSIKNEIALELNNTGIIDNIRKRKYKWSEIYSIDFLWVKKGSFIEIILTKHLLNKSKLKLYLNKIVNRIFQTTLISLLFIEGNNKEIFEQFENYFHKIKNNR